MKNYFIWIPRFLPILIFVIPNLLGSTLQAQEQPSSPLIDSYQTHAEMKSATTYGLEWIPLGPTVNGARVEAVQADPNRPGTIYAAFGSGGLWKTTNNGMTWKPIFENMPSLGIGDIALAPSAPEVLYVGTGESLKKARNFTMPGTGVYRSADGGNSWSHIGLNDTWHIGEIAVHPENPDVVLVAALGHFWSSNAHRGIFRTEDGGKSWEHVLKIDEKTGANDIVFSPADPDVLYASMWENYPNVNGKQSAIYTSVDGGKSWKKATQGIDIDKNTGRIGLAASYQDKNKAYAFIDQRNRGRKRGAGEIYQTLDGGKSWSKTHKEDIMSLSVIGWYFMDLYVNPKDDEEIFGLGVRLLHSKDGGKSFDYIGGQVTHLTPNPSQTLHLDHCEMWINPLNPAELILGNDGGLYHSYDKGQSWLHLNNIPAGEFYDIELDKGNPYTIYGGTQDDATVFGPAKEWNPKFDDPWDYLWVDAWSGGDGCITLVDPNDSNTVYFSMQNGAARRLDLTTRHSVSIRPRFPKKKSVTLQYNFITPYMLSRYNANRVYMAGNHVMRSDDRGDHWTIISPDLIKMRKHSLTETAAGAMAESYFDDKTLYVGTDRGTFWRTDNGGDSWQNMSTGLPPLYIRSIYPSQHQNGRIYLQLTGLNYDDMGAHLFVSEDEGEHWNSISPGLPDHPINTIVEDPTLENVLYAGTYRGVYVSENRGRNWSYFGQGMPDISIADIAIEPQTKDMVVATHGRGIYKVNLSPFYQKIESNISANHLFEIPSVKRPLQRDTHRDIDEKSIQKAPISFWLSEAEQVKLKITTSSDSLIWETAIEGRTGFNTYRWDLVTQTKKSNSPYFIHYKKYIEAGNYHCILENSGGMLRQHFRIIN